MRHAILERLALAFLWLYWRVPRLWMNRTAYAFWIVGERQEVQAMINRRARPTDERKERS